MNTANDLVYLLFKMNNFLIFSTFLLKWSEWIAFADRYSTTTTTDDTTDKDGGDDKCDYSDCKPDVSNCNDYDWYTQQGDNTPKTFGEEFIEAYEDAKDKDCDQLEQDWENRFNDFTTHDYVSPGTYYYNLNPFDDDMWHSQVKPPPTCATPGCEASYRYSAGVLLILDCLMKKKGCKAYPTNF
ncbi:MAG TPA: hypothetical protein PLI22_02955 [Caldisericia bacterium]|jgi:hypothetical protein|nr:hypothetical protein [Caldisericia bacterium]